MRNQVSSLRLTSVTEPRLQTAARRAIRSFAQLWRTLRFARARRATVAALLALDDRLLRDVGFERCQIAFGAARAVPRLAYATRRLPGTTH